MSPAVLVLHPHPDMGGDMHNPVVESVFRAATSAGLVAHRFDFTSSVMDVAVAEAAEHLPAGASVVVGYSFGALVASQLLDDRITGWVLVAPPFGMGGPAAAALIGTDERPKLVLAPAHDQFCPPPSARAATSDWANASVEEIAGADHFLAGGLAAVAGRSLEFVAATAGR